VDVAAHGVEAMGLSIEWAMLSSAMGLCLGVMMVWAGRGWIRGRGWAGAVSWAYVMAGLAVNGSDLVIFAFRAKAGAMRTGMLAADGAALAIPVVLGVWLVMREKHRPSGGGENREGCDTAGKRATL
jgi:hypothetical protein